MDYSLYPYFAGLGLVVSFVLFRLGLKYAPEWGLVDKPGGRKQHEGAIPLIGGLVIISVYTALVYSSGLQSQTFLGALIWGVVLLIAIGVLDDKYNINPWARFIIQIWLACYVVIFCDANIGALGNLWGFGDVSLTPFVGKVFSAVCFVLLMNAINMLDGIDGLAGGFLLVALGWLMTAALGVDAMILFWAMLFLTVPIFGFLGFNARYPFHPQARVFMGDAGSLSLALIVGWFAIQMAKSPEPYIAPVVIIWIMSLPIMDTFALFFTRKKQGRSPFSSDRLHIHYKLMDRGFSPALVMVMLWCFALVTGGIGDLGSKAGVPDYVLLYSWSAILLGYTFYRIKKETA